VRRSALVIAAAYSAVWLACFWEQTLTLSGPDPGLLEDVVIYALVMVALAIVHSTLGLLRQVDTLLSELPDRDVATPGAVTSSRESVRDFIALRDPRSKRWYALSIGVCLVLVGLFQVVIPLAMPQPVRGWALQPLEYPISWTAAVVWATFIFVFILGNVLWYGLATAFTVFPLVREHLNGGTMNIIPVAPDGRGGLARVGTVAFKLNLMAGSGMVVVVAWMVLFGIDASFVLGFVVYIALLIGVFFLPLMAIHRAMESAKEAELTRFAHLFEAAYLQLRAEADYDPTGPGRRREEIVQYLASLERLYQRAEAMPVWPFNFQILGQFTTLILVPLVLFVVQLVSQNAITSFLQGLSR
jgi:hypothetical protein